VFDHPTVRGLAAVAQSIDPGPVVAGRDASFALTPIQAAFVTTPRVVMDYYNQAVLLTVAPGVAGRSLRRALAALAAHHGLLRARFVQDAAGWRGAIAPAARTPDEALCVVALERVSSAAVRRVQARVCAQWQRSLCLATGPVWRAGLVTRADGTRRLLLAAHHLIVDGVSWRILLEDLQQAVAQVERGMAVHLPPASSSFAQWSAAVQTAATGWPVAAEQAWWRATAAAPVAPLPCDAPSAASTVDVRQAANRVGTARTVTVSLSAAATTRLVRRMAQAMGSGTEAVLLTAVAGAVGRWSGAPAMRVALEGHGREELPGVDVSRTVGWFTTIYPVTLPVTGAPASRLRAVSDQLTAMPRRGFGYGLLRTHVTDAAVRAERLADAAPEIIVNYLGQFDAIWAAARLIRPSTEPAGPSQDPREPRPFVLDIIGEVRDGILRLHWTYSHALHTRETIDALAHECLREIEQLLDAPVLPDDALSEPAHAGTTALPSLLDTETVARALAQVEF
jgi:non-ribosomal peptide synthase protein (TIGR01720 family)